MVEEGRPITLTKAYRGVKGRIRGITDSSFEFYIAELETGIRIVVGPSGFVVEDD